MPRHDRFFATNAPIKESFGLDPRFHDQTWASLALSAVSMFGYLFLDHAVPAMCRSPSGNAPTTRVHHLISRRMHSSGLLVRIRAATSQTRRQLGAQAFDPRFVEHVVMLTLNFDDIKFSGY